MPSGPRRPRWPSSAGPSVLLVLRSSRDERPGGGAPWTPGFTAHPSRHPRLSVKGKGKKDQGGASRTQRKPTEVAYIKRSSPQYDTRRFLGLLTHEPPRRTREVPEDGPLVGQQSQEPARVVPRRG